MSHNVDQALKRPSNYCKLDPETQWEIDKELGILDWDPTPEEVAEYKRRKKK
jgi:hypothetical protein